MPPRMIGPVRLNKHKREETTKTTKEKQKRKQTDMDSSHSVSTTNLNHQSVSWECPLSAKKHMIPDSMISSRRSSLRSAKKLTETGITSVSRCSRPQKSKENSSANDIFQLLDDDPVDTTLSANQVPADSLEGSPSRYLTLAPKMRHEETEKVGNSITPEKSMINVQMEEVHEAEKSMSNHSNQMDGQNTLELDCVPLEKEPLAEDIQTSNNFEERANKTHSKSISMVRPTSPSFSLKLTEMVNMWDDEEDEINSVRQSSPVDTVEGYQVKPEFVPISRKILIKHGDIFKSCMVWTAKYRSTLLEMICEIILELEDNDFRKIKEDELHDMIAVVNEIKNIKVDIEWLHLRLVEILEAREILKQSGKMKEDKDGNRRIIEIVENELEQCEAQKKAMAAKLQSICNKETVCKETLARAKDESIKIAATIKSAKSKVRRFLNCSLADGLL